MQEDNTIMFTINVSSTQFADLEYEDVVVASEICCADACPCQESIRILVGTLQTIFL